MFAAKAPKARDMTARGKREAKRNASPLVKESNIGLALKGRNTATSISAFQALPPALAI